MKKCIIEKNYVAESEISELDFYLNDDLKVGENDDKVLEINNGKSLSWSGESYPINIYRLIGLLNEMKDKHKCEYVEVMYHSDHIGYVITGLNISKFDENTIRYKSLLKDYKEKAELSKEKRIAELEMELNTLKKLKKLKK